MSQYNILQNLISASILKKAHAMLCLNNVEIKIGRMCAQIRSLFDMQHVCIWLVGLGV